MFWSSERKPMYRKRGNGWKQLYTMNWTTTNAEAVSQRCSVKEEHLWFFFSFLVKSLRPATLLKKSLWHRYFQNFQNFLVHIFYRTPLDDCFLNFKILMKLWTYEFQMRKTAYIELSFLPIALKYCHVSCFHCYCYSIVENRKSSPLVDDQVELPSS